MSAACSRTATSSASDARAEAPTAAYCFFNNSCAFADHGISSQSRQSHPVLNSSQKTGRGCSSLNMVEKFSLQLCIVKKAPASACVADAMPSPVTPKTFARGILVTTDDYHRPRPHVFLLTDNTRHTSMTKISKGFSRMLQKTRRTACFARRHRGSR